MESAIGNRTAKAGPRFYSVAEVAEIFRMSSMTVYRAIAAGEVPAVRIRGRLIIPALAVEAMIDSAMAEQKLADFGSELSARQLARGESR